MTFPKPLNFDHQATTPVNERVLSEMLPYFTEKNGNPHSSDHIIGWQSSGAVDDAARKIALMIGADQDEIVFTAGASEANNLALLGLAKHAAHGPRNRILVSAIEHKCVLEVSRVLSEQYGYKIDYIPVDNKGRIPEDAFSALLDETVLAVSIMAVNNEIGTIQDIEALSKAARHAGAIFHCDAAQAPLAMNISTLARRTDLLSLSAHKMYGPQGIGALYIRRDLHDQIEPLIYGGGQQNGLRSGTVPVALCVGMGAAAELICEADSTGARNLLRERRDNFARKVLRLNPDFHINGPSSSSRHPGNANICFRGYSAGEMLNAFQPRLAASSGSACTTGTPELSHVLRAIGLSGDDSESSIRFSLGFGTSEQDIDAATGIVEETLTSLSTELADTA
ncbi:cysteine desulfurase family protein [Woeseia oceani]|uniref:cysteine desulfurase n=1 Tax=Woeseia oceani TaxID=1548547 RepID=A0A193LI27_9GAMM|nr:cysteine desulfurase family protein [Woeseia oceani]ANO52146.1 cysteine sulfinate desulfinase [Woeseia oceani]